MNILTNSITNQWFEAVHQAQELACFHFKEPQVERYVVDLLNKNRTFRSKKKIKFNYSEVG